MEEGVKELCLKAFFFEHLADHWARACSIIESDSVWGLFGQNGLDNRRHKRSIAGIEDIVVVGEVVLFLVICREPRFTWHVNAETTAAPTKRDATIARKNGSVGRPQSGQSACSNRCIRSAETGYRQKMVGKKISDCGRGTHFSAPHFLPFWILDLRTETSSCIAV